MFHLLPGPNPPSSILLVPHSSSPSTTTIPAALQISHPIQVTETTDVGGRGPPAVVPVIVHALVGCTLSPSRRQTMVVVITDGHVACHVRGVAVMQIDKVDVVTLVGMEGHDGMTPEEITADEEFKQLLSLALNSHHFFYSANPIMYDVTNSLQRHLHDKRSPDERFIWNMALLDAITTVGNLRQKYCCMMIQGLVSSRSHVLALPNCPMDSTITLTLITRRGNANQGTRFFARGIDDTGAAANFCETEQIVAPNYNKVLYSFVQTRGSLPTVWTQYPTLKYAPEVYVPKNETEGQARFSLHMFGQLSKSLYGGGKIYLVNLIDRQGGSSSSKDQAQLGHRIERHCETFQDKHDLKLEWFDFHHECRNGWDRLSVLMEDMSKPLDEIGFFAWGDNKTFHVQHGVIRTNCMDNLDRTNVVQSLFARRIALKQLQDAFCHVDGGGGGSDSGGNKYKMPTPKNVLDSGLLEFEIAFKNVWADNADAISMAYAGTNALKTDFTRTGKRTRAGMMNDVRNSASRYFLNNFWDGIRQDALDVLLTQDDIVKDRLLLLARRGQLELTSVTRPKRVRMMLAIVLFVLLLFCGLWWFGPNNSFVTTLLVLMGFVGWQLRFGAWPIGLAGYLVTKPRLRFIVNLVG